jgi:hypothetical protein
VLEIDRRRAFAYESVYFDTSDLLTYRQHLQGRRRRYKVRTRAYLDTADCAFEVKFNGSRDQTIKAQLPYRLTDRARITPRAQAFLARQLDQAHGQPTPQLFARVTTSYQRTTLVDLERGTRLTCDVDLVCIGSGRRAVGPAHHVLVGVQERRAIQRRGCFAAAAWTAPCADQQILHRGRVALPGRPLQSLASDAAPLLRGSN